MGDFDHFDVEERYAKEAADRKRKATAESNAAWAARDAREAKESRERATAFTLANNERIRLHEFAAAGVEPLEGNKTSLGLLLKFGWRIEEILGQKRLVRPDPEMRTRKTREDWELERGEST